MKKNIVIFASGTGSNFINIYNKTKSNAINGRVRLLVSNNPSSGAVEFAINNKIDFFIYNKTRFPYDQNSSELIQKINSCSADLILLAGYMKKISHAFIDHFKNRIMNIHPSLLPRYGGKGCYGIKVHEMVYKNNDSETGATVHFVDYNYDSGPILLQHKLKIKKGENPNIISKKVLEIEHKIYYQAVKLFCSDKILWKNNKPLIKE